MKTKNKKCSKCGIKKLLSEFHLDKSRKDGYTHACKKCRNELTRQWNVNNKEYIKKRWKKYYNRYKQERLIYTKNWIKNNKKRFRKTRNEYYNNKRNNDIRFKISDNLRKRVFHALKNNIKSLDTMLMVGCEIDYLLYYIQEQFKPGMAWDNYGNKKGQWNIDHIRPCASFDLSKPEEQRKCFHYTNLQPLWAEDNRKKSSFIKLDKR